MTPRPKPKYPWNDWLKSGKTVVLRRGKDYPKEVQPHGMAQQVRDNASARGKSVRVKIDGDTVTVYIPTPKEQRAIAAKRALAKRA